ncbi:hypothetical protein SCAR479_12103 [Seiridium cardinale]|uniref:Uncharacterized protein n=1 Tax=Seiridium cardinale TaxID=138064 RepID=A0ABR2XBS6_9PEZI
MLKHTLEEQENHLRAIKRTLEEAQKLKDEAFNALSPDRHSKLVHDSLKQMAQSQDTRSTEIYQSLNQLISKTSKLDTSDEASITAQLTRIQSIQASTTAKQESRLATIEQSLAKSSSLSASLQTDIHKISESVSRIEKTTPPRVFDDAIINRIEKMLSLNVKSSAQAGQGVTQRAPGIPTPQAPAKQTALAEKRPRLESPEPQVSNTSLNLSGNSLGRGSASAQSSSDFRRTQPRTARMREYIQLIITRLTAIRPAEESGRRAEDLVNSLLTHIISCGDGYNAARLEKFIRQAPIVSDDDQNGWICVAETIELDTPRYITDGQCKLCSKWCLQLRRRQRQVNIGFFRVKT